MPGISQWKEKQCPFVFCLGLGLTELVELAVGLVLFEELCLMA